MNIRFNLKEPYKNGLSAVNIVLQFRNQKVKYAIGQTIDRKFWNVDLQRAYIPKGEKRNAFPYAEFNQCLQDIETATTRFVLSSRNDKNRLPTTQEIKAELDKITNRQTKKPVQLFDFLQTRIEELKKERKSDAMSKKYITVLNYLKEYATLLNRNNFDFEDLNELFFIKIKQYFYEVKKHNPNTFHKNIGTLKIALREAFKQKLHYNTDFQNVTIKKVPTHEIYLTESELEKIYNIDLSNKQGHDITRDLFIVGCFTSGLRFSDWSKIRTEQIAEKDGKLFCTVVTEKTGQTITFPLTHPYVKNILNKYNNQLPNPISNQKSNLYLKDIGQLASLDDLITKISYEGEKRKETKVHKYEMIVTHTARRSFATNLAIRKYPLQQIRLLTGHSSERQLIQYLKTSSLENALTVADSEFFNG